MSTYLEISKQVIAEIYGSKKPVEADDDFLGKPFPVGYQGLPRTEVEAAIRYLDKHGYTDPVLRKYNVLCWVRGYYQESGQNHGSHYADLVTEQYRLGDILREDGY